MGNIHLFDLNQQLISCISNSFLNKLIQKVRKKESLIFNCILFYANRDDKNIYS